MRNRRNPQKAKGQDLKRPRTNTATYKTTSPEDQGQILAAEDLRYPRGKDSRPSGTPRELQRSEHTPFGGLLELRQLAEGAWHVEDGEITQSRTLDKSVCNALGSRGGAGQNQGLG